MYRRDAKYMERNNTVLHLDTTENPISSNNLISVQVENSSSDHLENAPQVTGVSSVVHHSTRKNQIIFSTAIIFMQTKDGGWPCLIIGDSHIL